MERTEERAEELKEVGVGVTVKVTASDTVDTGTYQY